LKIRKWDHPVLSKIFDRINKMIRTQNLWGAQFTPGF
jgi:hypothetical protein